MSDLRKALVKLANERPETRKHLIPLLQKHAMDFPTEEALRKYLKEHPGADKTKHRVVETKGGKGNGQAPTKKPNFGAIAKKHLGINSLKTQNSDRQDFHDVSVGGIKNALKDAFEAGGGKASDAALEAIAKKHLGVRTLKVRNSDELDFYDLSVGSIEKALQAAFEAGSKR